MRTISKLEEKITVNDLNDETLKHKFLRKCEIINSDLLIVN
jgi:hypothetical protein